MNEKISGYIGLFIGILLTFTVLFANNDFRISSNKQQHYLYTSFIGHTASFHILKNTFGALGLRRGYKNNFSGIFWIVLFLAGIWCSWKYRFKTGETAIKISNKVHKKITNKPINK